MAQGIVKWFNTWGKDVFVHTRAIERAGMHGLNEGQKVSFDVVSDRRRQVLGGKFARRLIGIAKNHNPDHHVLASGS